MLWKAFCFLPPVLYSGRSFFYWHTHPDLSGYDAEPVLVVILAYILILLIYAVLYALDGWLRTAKVIISLISSTTAFLISIKFRWEIVTIGFILYSFPAKEYVAKHCHTTQFEQDGRAYTVGLCKAVAVTGVGDELAYDTSGDIAKIQDTKNTIHSSDRRELVSAIRRILGKYDSLEQFEDFSFEAYKLYGSFYWVHFNETEGTGFSKEYGPP